MGTYGKFGLLGQHLSHSFSPQIHDMLVGYEYKLYDIEPDKLDEFLTTTDLAGMNVTMPYKKTALPYCVEVSENARRIGSINTLVRRDDGWYGENTDYYGFQYMVASTGYSVKGKKVLVFGSGGASVSVCAALEDMGVGEIVVISCTGVNNYTNLFLHRDAHVLVNTTPVGMYPNNGLAVATVKDFPACEAVFDIVYNPLKTALLLQAEELGLINSNGFVMLVQQARKSAELFTGTEISEEHFIACLHKLQLATNNVTIVGMPGSGKSTVGKALADKAGLDFFDADAEIKSFAGMSAEDIILTHGEDAFRKVESQVLSMLGRRSGCVIATGGGCVTRDGNYPMMHQNAKIIWLQRDIDKLPTSGRPISKSTPLQELYAKREGMYRRFADIVIDNNGTVDETVSKILEALK